MSTRRVARPPVLRGIPLDRHAVIEASAGTGKTFTLEHLIVELLLATDTSLDRILVVTFTEKATNELRARVRTKLQDLLAGRGEPASEQDVARGDCWTIDEAARAKLQKALHAFDGTTISTIHAFCQRVLRENAFSSGRLFEEQHVDGRDAFGRAFREALRRDVACDPLRAPWLEAALSIGWNLVTIEDLLWKCIQARGDLRPSFDAASLARALEAFPVDDARLISGPEEMQRWGLPAVSAKAAGRRIYQVADAVEKARETCSAPSFVLEAQSIDLKFLLERLPAVPPRPGPTARVCVAALELVRATPPFRAALAHALLEPVRRELARSKREAGQYDFDDMLAFVDEALRGPRSKALVEAMRERWRYALIDEFQDTDETQWSIFQRAFFDCRGAPSVLYLVGDPKQSIYRFRGADVQTYLRAKAEITAAGGSVVTLDRNHRATQALVDATNALFDQQAPDPVFTGDVLHTPVACGRPDRALVDGDGHAVPPIYAFRFHSGAGDPIPLAVLGSHIAREVRAITNEARPWRFDGRVVLPSDVFVLTRNAREGRIVGAALRDGGVPHAFYKEDGLFRTDEAREVRALLLAIADPADRGRRLAAWLTPFFGLALSEMERARDLSIEHPLVARLHMWKALADAHDFERFFESIVSASGILRREIFFAEGERELTNYLHVLEVLLEQARGPSATLGDLVNLLSGLIDGTRLPLDLEGSVQRLESDRPVVQIMTIHKSKGLEAPIVFIAGGFSQPPGDDVRIYHEGPNRLAWVGSIDDASVEAKCKREEREEEQRLMYVALTRAQGRLYLPCAVEDGTSTKGKRLRGDPRPLRGPYEPIQRRVLEMARSSAPGLSVQDVIVGSVPPGPIADPGAASWVPPSELLREPGEAMPWTALREQHAGAIVTSYTRMRGSLTARQARTEEGEDRSRASVVQVKKEVEAGTLRGARTSGVFLHEVLERVPLTSFGASGEWEAWRTRPDVRALFDRAMAIHGVEPSQREHAERLVWRAYTMPVSLPDGRSLRSLSSARTAVREMEFAFPIPERHHPTLGESLAQPVSIARGYVRGSLDLAIEHDGITYFVDWKSDSLRSYELGALDTHVLDHYRDQAALYSLAIVKLLDARTPDQYEARFGGLLYCFLRGIEVEDRGIWSMRPSWSDVLGWEDEFRARRYWGARGDT